VERLTVTMGAGLLVLSAYAFLLPGSTAIRMLMAGVS
jgi:hypothetical protein